MRFFLVDRPFRRAMLNPLGFADIFNIEQAAFAMLRRAKGLVDPLALGHGVFVLRTRPCVLAIAPSRSELFSGKESTGSGIKFLVTNYDHRPDRGWRKLSDR